MATIPYITELTLVDESNISLNSLPPPTVFGGLNLTLSTMRNMITNHTYSLISYFPTSPLPSTDTLNSVTGGFGTTFGDSVYHYQGSIEIADDYIGNDYLLVTTAIDAGIAALPITTPAEIARKAYLVQLRQDIQDEFNAADYVTANAYIGAAISYLYFQTSASVGGTFVYNAPDEFDATISVLAFPYFYWGGWYNAVTNTLTNVVYPYTFNFDPNNGGTTTVTNSPLFPDGVYQNYMSVLGSISATESNLFFYEDYALVTTTIDDQITLYGAQHDPLNTAEAIIYAELLANQAAWIVAFAANDYTETNALIAATQSIILNQGLSIELFAALTSDNLMNVYFDALPSGTYTNPTGVITNTLTGISFNFDGFPSSNLDLATVLNSETLGFGADFPDGVYQVQVQFFVDGLLFTGLCYLVVTTDWQCCIDKAVGKKCGKLNTALMQANLTNAVRIVAVYSDVNTANALISEGYRECSGCGCGCS